MDYAKKLELRFLVVGSRMSCFLICARVTYKKKINLYIFLIRILLLEKRDAFEDGLRKLDVCDMLEEFGILEGSVKVMAIVRDR